MKEDKKGFIKKQVLKKLLNWKSKLILTLIAVFVCFIAFFVLFIVASHEDFFPLGSSAELSGFNSSIDDDKTTKELVELYDIHTYDVKNAFSLSDEDSFVDKTKEKANYTEETAEQNNFFQEVRRQRTIWIDDYNSFGISHNPGALFFVIDEYKTNTLDAVDQLATIHYQGNVYVNSHFMNFDDGHDDIQIKPDGTKLDEYEGEKLVNNRDTRDFYEQAKDKLGSTFFWYPGTREMFGNSISAEVTWDPAKALYLTDSTGTSVISIVNIGLLMSDYHVLAKMSLQDENAYQAYIDPERFPRGPYTDLGYFIRALDDGYNKCFYEKDKTLQNWTWLNVCNDYKLFFEEVEYLGEYYTHITSADQLQQIINDAVPETHNLKHAIFPQYETQEDGRIAHNFRDDIKKVEEELAKNPKPNSVVPGFQYFIEVTVDRYYDEELYDKYLKELYIPYIYINCDSCGFKNEGQGNTEKIVEQIYTEMKQFEKAYRYYNGEGLMELGSNDSNISNGTADIEGTDYTCDSGSMPNLATYPGHQGVDINGVPVGTNIYPLFDGEVVSVHHYNYNCYPVKKANGGYDCSHCGSNGYGNMVKIKGKAADGNEYYAIYGHLNEINVSVGQKVTTNTVIGTVGNTGCSTGAHLHLELRTMSNGVVYATQIYNEEAVKSTLCSRSVEEEV